MKRTDLVSVFDGTLQVEHRQHEENECLDGLSKNEQEVHRQRAQDRRQEEHQDKDNFLTADVTEKTQSQAERTCHVRDRLKDQHERSQKADRTHEVLDVAGAPFFDTHEVVEQEHDDRHGGGSVDVRGRSITAWDQADVVHHEDEQEDGTQQRHELTAFLAEVGDSEVFQTADNGLKQVLQPAGNHLQSATNNKTECEKNTHCQPHVQHVVD